MWSSDAQKTQFPNGFQRNVLKDRLRERIGGSVCLISLCHILWLVLGNQDSAISVSWLQSSRCPSAGDQHAVNFFHLVAISVSAKELKIYSSEDYLELLRGLPRWL